MELAKDFVKLLNGITLFGILTAVLTVIWIAFTDPVDFGVWLAEIDTGRYGVFDCDCTEELYFDQGI